MLNAEFMSLLDISSMVGSVCTISSINISSLSLVLFYFHIYPVCQFPVYPVSISILHKGFMCEKDEFQSIKN